MKIASTWLGFISKSSALHTRGSKSTWHYLECGAGHEESQEIYQGWLAGKKSTWGLAHDRATGFGVTINAHFGRPMWVTTGIWHLYPVSKFNVYTIVILKYNVSRRVLMRCMWRDQCGLGVVLRNILSRVNINELIFKHVPVCIWPVLKNLWWIFL